MIPTKFGHEGIEKSKEMDSHKNSELGLDRFKHL